jgi:hypothetical protein
LRLDAVEADCGLSAQGAKLAPLRPDWMRVGEDKEQ